MEENKGLKEALLAALQEKKPIMLGHLAASHKVSELEVARALPEEMRAFAPASALESVWDELTGWARATFIMQHLGSVLEVKSRIPAGKHMHGYFNLMGEAPLNGHLKTDDLEAICFLSMPFMGLESHSLQFFNREGAVKFSIYAGRGENREILPEVRESFMKLRQKEAGHA